MVNVYPAVIIILSTVLGIPASYGSPGCRAAAGLFMNRMFASQTLSGANAPLSASLTLKGAHFQALLDTPGNDCKPAHVVIIPLRTNADMLVSRPTPHLRTVRVHFAPNGAFAIATDLQGRTARTFISQGTAITMYRFEGIYHLAIAKSKNSEPPEVGIRAGPSGPRFFNLRWPDPGKVGRWPLWPNP